MRCKNIQSSPNPKIKQKKNGKHFCFSNNNKNNEGKKKTEEKRAQEIQIIVFSVFSSACPLQMLLCVLHLGGQNEGNHLKCCLVILNPTGIKDQLYASVLWYLLFGWVTWHYLQIFWHKLTSSSGCSSCWPPHAARWDVGSLCLWYIQRPFGRFAVPSRAHRCIQQETSLDAEGTSFKRGEKGKWNSNKNVISGNSQWDHSLTWCTLHFYLSFSQRPRESKPWRTGERKHWLRATASCRRSEPSLHPVTAPQTPSQENKVHIIFSKCKAHSCDWAGSVIQQ